MPGRNVSDELAQNIYITQPFTSLKYTNLYTIATLAGNFAGYNSTITTSGTSQVATATTIGAYGASVTLNSLTPNKHYLVYIKTNKTSSYGYRYTTPSAGVINVLNASTTTTPNIFLIDFIADGSTELIHVLNNSTAAGSSFSIDSFGVMEENSTNTLLAMMINTNGDVGYRFSFNGMMKDNEIKGNGNSLAFKHRIYDSRLGKFLSVDPMAKTYPWNSNYAFAENDPINFIDLEGLEKGKRRGVQYNIFVVGNAISPGGAISLERNNTGSAHQFPQNQWDNSTWASSNVVTPGSYTTKTADEGCPTVIYTVTYKEMGHGLDVVSIDQSQAPPPPIVNTNVVVNPSRTSVLNISFEPATATNNNYNPTFSGGETNLSASGQVVFNSFVNNLTSSLTPNTSVNGNIVTTTTRNLTSLAVQITTGFPQNTGNLNTLLNTRAASISTQLNSAFPTCPVNSNVMPLTNTPASVNITQNTTTTITQTNNTPTSWDQTCTD
jgi:RHS repeat-associated protein